MPARTVGIEEFDALIAQYKALGYRCSSAKVYMIDPHSRFSPSYPVDTLPRHVFHKGEKKVTLVDSFHCTYTRSAATGSLYALDVFVWFCSYPIYRTVSSLKVRHYTVGRRTQFYDDDLETKLGGEKQRLG